MIREVALALIAILGSLAPSSAAAENWFVITSTFDTQRAAQVAVVDHGGWTLDTDAYSGLAPGMYAVVRGPFSTRATAESDLAWLTDGGRYPGAYAKEAGEPLLPAALIGSASSAALAWLLGEIAIEIGPEEQPENPVCTPDEPYREIKLLWTKVDSRIDGEELRFFAQRVPLDVGFLAVVSRTGELFTSKICLE